MLVFVAGPYLPAEVKREDMQAGSLDAGKQQKLKEHTDAEGDAVKSVIGSGHIPLLPYPTVKAWENNKPYDTDIEDYYYKLINECDAVYAYKGPESAAKEQNYARSQGKLVFTSADQIARATFKIDDKAKSLEAYLIDYQQCMEGYRHGYEKIWQSAAVFIAIGAAILAFYRIEGGSIPTYALVLAPAPILFWWQGIFRPMYRNGKTRRQLLIEIERKINELVRDLEVKQFTTLGEDAWTIDYDKSQRIVSIKPNNPKPNWFMQYIRCPRVRHTVHLLAGILIAVESILVVKGIVLGINWIHSLGDPQKFWG